MVHCANSHCHERRKIFSFEYHSITTHTLACTVAHTRSRPSQSHLQQAESISHTHTNTQYAHFEPISILAQICQSTILLFDGKHLAGFAYDSESLGFYPPKTIRFWYKCGRPIKTNHSRIKYSMNLEWKCKVAKQLCAKRNRV